MVVSMMREQRVACRHRRQADGEAVEIVVLVAFAAMLKLVVAVAAGEIVLGGKAEAEQRGDIDVAIGGADDAGAGAHVRRGARPRRVSSIGGIDQIGLVEDHQVGGDELVLEQLAQRGLVVEHFVGLAACASTAASSAAKRPSASAAASTTVTTPSMVTSALISGQLKARISGCGRARPEVSMTMWSGRSGRSSSCLHGGDEVLGDGAADAAVGELDHVLVAAGLVAAAGEDLLVDAEIAELVDDQRDALALGVGRAGGGPAWSCRRRESR